MKNVLKMLGNVNREVYTKEEIQWEERLLNGNFTKVDVDMLTSKVQELMIKSNGDHIEKFDVNSILKFVILRDEFKKVNSTNNKTEYTNVSLAWKIQMFQESYKYLVPNVRALDFSVEGEYTDVVNALFKFIDEDCEEFISDYMRIMKSKGMSIN